MSEITTDQKTDLLAKLAEAGAEDGHQADHLADMEAEALRERRLEREGEMVHEFSRQYPYRPHDGAVAMHRVLTRLFGTVGIGQSTFSIFGEQKPELRDIAVGVNETLSIPFGQVAFPIFGDEACFVNGATRMRGHGIVYQLSFNAPKRFAAHVRGLFKEVQRELDTNSIYRGHAFDGSYQFIDPLSIDPDAAVYSAETNEAIRADLWGPIEHAGVMRELGIPLKHAVLLPGGYGTGKTLLGMITGQKAIKAGWTFIQSRPGSDNYHDVMRTARLYQPCVVFFEDIDTFASTGEDDALAQLLEVYDGATAKGAEIVAVFTTNHPERIHKAMVRPGRIDAVIPIGQQDADSIRRIVLTTVPADRLADDVDFEAVSRAMDGFTPAFVKEASHRAVRHAIARTGSQPDRYVTDDLVGAANSMRHHLEMMEQAGEGERGPTLEEMLGDMLVEALEDRLKLDTGSFRFVEVDEDDDE